MVNSSVNVAAGVRLVATYVVLTIASIVALVVLAARGSDQATSEAWGHAIIVVVFCVLLPLRIRAARRGSRSAARAVAIIAVVVLVVNLVEAVLPTFPAWMRVQMAAVVVVMALLVFAMRGALRPARAVGDEVSRDSMP